VKLKGKKIEGANREVIILPRSNGEDLVFIAEAIISYDEFDQIVPAPKPGTKIVPGGGKVADFDSPTYAAELKRYATLRYLWTILKSLKATPGLEWETIVYSEPSTWENFYSELKAAGLSETEQKMLLVGVSTANCLNQAKLDEARDRFLAGTGLEQLVESCSRPPEPSTTPSGDAAKPGV
jgi:hypothetical protein